MPPAVVQARLVDDSEPAGRGECAVHAGGLVPPAYPNPRETDMEHAINEGDVHKVDIRHTVVDGVTHVIAAIEHDLTPQQEHELTDLVERMIVRSIALWAAP